MDVKANVGANAAPVVTTQPKAANAPPPVVTKAAPKVETPKHEPVDKADVKTQQKVENPYKGYNNATEVKVDKWGKGKNDCVEHILKNQGYSLKEIYGKDAEGKTMIQKVAEANGLEDPNLIHPDQKLVVPSKEVKEADTKDLKAGEKTGHEVGTDKAGVKVELEKKADGSSEAKAETKNQERDAKLKHEVDAPKGGNIHVKSEASKTDEAKSTIVARTGDGKGAAETTSTIVAKPDSSKVTVRDTDGNVNTKVTADDNKVVTENAAADGKKITTKTDISEDASDGFFERTGRKVSEFFTGKEEPKDGGKVVKENVKQVTVTKDKEGVATVTAEGKDGKKEVIKKTAGDTDDGVVERAGEKVDHAVDKTVEVSKKVYNKGKEIAGDAYDKGKELAGEAKDKVKSWWNAITG